jgi:hypothetical protein
MRPTTAALACSGCVQSAPATERALVSIVRAAWVAGVSTRKVDQVVESLGAVDLHEQQSVGARLRRRPGHGRLLAEDARAGPDFLARCVRPSRPAGALVFALVPGANAATAYGVVAVAFLWELCGALMEAANPAEQDSMPWDSSEGRASCGHSRSSAGGSPAPRGRRGGGSCASITVAASFRALPTPRSGAASAVHLLLGR